MTAVLAKEKHYTASAFLITNGTPKKVFLLFHTKLQTWFQPGGHIEQFENPVEAAIREVKEETGIDISQLQKCVVQLDDDSLSLPVPQFLLQETIPAYKDQPMHFHIDNIYVVTIPEQVYTIAADESQKAGWFTKEEALALPLFENTKMIIQKLL